LKPAAGAWRRVPARGPEEATVADDSHQAYYSALQQEEKMLLILRDELYAGSWDRMRTDLQNRLAGKPYIFKLVHRIEEDLGRISKLEGYEAKHGINLADFAEKEVK
jgi:hypothetical protein